MFYYLNVSGSNKEVIYSGEVNSDLFDQIVKTKYKKIASLPLFLLFPKRTNSVPHFLQDLFVPLTTRWSSKLHAIQNTALKIIAFLGTIAVDLFTLAARIVTCLPRIVYNLNHPEKPYPLFDFLAELDPPFKGQSGDLEISCLELKGKRYSPKEIYDCRWVETTKTLNSDLEEIRHMKDWGTSLGLKELEAEELVTTLADKSLAKFFTYTFALPHEGGF